MLRSLPDTLTLRIREDGFATVPVTRANAWTPWASALAALPLEARIAQLELPIEKQHARLDVVLDSALTRMQVITFPAGVRKPEERSAYLKASFRHVFGLEASRWHIAVEPAYFHEPVPALAVDSAIMQAVTILCERHELKLRSLRTSFIDSFNRLRNKLTAHAGAFATLHDEHLCLGLWQRRSWLALSTQNIAAQNGAALSAALTQQLARIATPLSSGTLYVLSAHQPFRVPLAESWQIEWLSPGAR